MPDAQIAAIRLQFDKQQENTWKSYVIKTKELYRDRKYKQCIKFCEEVGGASTTVGVLRKSHKEYPLDHQLHPFHRTFFHFYRAICFESLGLAAHKFSKSKLAFFHASKAAFLLALESLTLPPVVTVDEGSKITEDLEAQQDSPSNYSPTESNPATPAVDSPTPCRAIPLLPEDMRADADSDVGLKSETDNDPDFNKYPWSLRKALDRTSSSQVPTARMNSNLKARLSESLSNEHIIDEALVPSPLFTRTTGGSSGRHNDITSRPLPELPFHHNATFIHKRNRIVQNLGVGNPRPLVGHTIIADESYCTPPSHFTPRYNYIHDTFEPKTSPSTGSDLGAYLSSDFCSKRTWAKPSQVTVSTSSVHAQCDNLQHTIMALRSRILAVHLPSLAQFIHEAEATQLSHYSREVPSYLLPKPISPTGCVMAGASSHHDHSPAQSYRTNVRSRQIRRNRHQDDGGAGTETEDKQVRIARLRESGWAVRKEKHGFEGRGYYEAKERIVFGELMGG